MKRLFLLALLVTGCGDGTEPEPVDTVRERQVTYTVTGGGETVGVFYAAAHGAKLSASQVETGWSDTVTLPSGAEAWARVECKGTFDAPCNVRLVIETADAVIDEQTAKSQDLTLEARGIVP